ncbi:glycosyltransferase family 4 protein [soil metagenome]
MKLAISFTNFGPYHLARLRALAVGLSRRGDRLLAIETAGAERLYPWRTDRRPEPFHWVTLFPGRELEDIAQADCSVAIEEVLEQHRPDALALSGYVRPECLAALQWSRRQGCPSILMSESQAIDRPRTWWREAIKRRRVRRFSAALVGGPSHRDYLIGLGMPADRIALGYNAVDNTVYAARAQAARRASEGRRGLPTGPYFLSVSRFASEKNLPGLVRAFSTYRQGAAAGRAWDLVLIGDGPSAAEVHEAVRKSGHAQAIHRPGFLQADEIARWYSFASAFVLASTSEPWGLVVNEAAACGLPLLVSERAGASLTLVPDPPGTTGRRFDPLNPSDLAGALGWMAGLPESDRQVLGRRAAEIVADWGPERFCNGTLEALELASRSRPRAVA